MTHSEAALFYWMDPSAREDCGHKGEIDSELHLTKEFVATQDYLTGIGGTFEKWDIHFHKTPCDIAATPFCPLVSEKFKNVADSFNVNVKYHKANVFISGERTTQNYYFPKLLDEADFVDIDSRGTTVNPQTSKFYPGWIIHSGLFSTIFYEKLDGKDWVTQINGMRKPWLVSLKFKTAIKDHGLTNFSFLPVKPSMKKI